MPKRKTAKKSPKMEVVPPVEQEAPKIDLSALTINPDEVVVDHSQVTAAAACKVENRGQPTPVERPPVNDVVQDPNKIMQKSEPEVVELQQPTDVEPAEIIDDIQETDTARLNAILACEKNCKDLLDVLPSLGINTKSIQALLKRVVKAKALEAADIFAKISSPEEIAQVFKQDEPMQESDDKASNVYVSQDEGRTHESFGNHSEPEAAPNPPRTGVRRVGGKGFFATHNINI